MTITFDKVSSLRYLSHLTSEMLRRYSPICVTLCAATEGTSLNRGLLPRGMPVVLFPLAINKTVVQWGTDAEELKAERWASDEGEVASVKRNCGFLSFLTR